MPLDILQKMGLIDLDKGTIIDSTGSYIPIEKAVQDGIMFEGEIPVEPKSLVSLIDEGCYDTSTGQFMNPDTAENLTLKQAIKDGVLDPHSLVVNDPGSGEVMTLEEGMDEGLIDGKTGMVKDTASREKITMKAALDRGILIPRPMPVATAIDIGLYNETTSKFLDPTCRQFFTLEEAIESGLIDSQSTIVDPSTGEEMALAIATACGVLDARHGNVVNVHTGETYTIREAIAMGRATIQKPLSVEEAIAEGLYSSDTNTFTDPRTQRELSFQEALQKNIIATDSYIIDPASGDRITIGEAIEEGILIPDTGNVINSDTGQMLSVGEVAAERPSTLADAMRKGLYHHATNTVIDPITKQELTLRVAIEKGVLDPKSFIQDPQTGELMSLDSAVDQGILDLDSGLVVNKQTGDRIPLHDVVSPEDEEEALMTLDQAMREGLYNSETNTVTHPETNERLSLDDAIEQGRH